MTINKLIPNNTTFSRFTPQRTYNTSLQNKNTVNNNKKNNKNILIGLLAGLSVPVAFLILLEIMKSRNISVTKRINELATDIIESDSNNLKLIQDTFSKNDTGLQQIVDKTKPFVDEIVLRSKESSNSENKILEMTNKSIVESKKAELKKQIAKKQKLDAYTDGICDSIILDSLTNTAEDTKTIKQTISYIPKKAHTISDDLDFDIDPYANLSKNDSIDIFRLSHHNNIIEDVADDIYDAAHDIYDFADDLF